MDNGDDDNEHSSISGHSEALGPLAKSAAAHRQMLKGDLGARHHEKQSQASWDFLRRLNDQTNFTLITPTAPRGDEKHWHSHLDDARSWLLSHGVSLDSLNDPEAHLNHEAA